MLPMSPRRSDASARPSTAAGAAPPPLGSSTMMSTIPLVDTITPRPEPLQPTPHPEQGARRRTLTMVVMNVIYAASAYPAGAASDLRGRQTILVGGFAALIIADLVLATANEVWQVMAGVAL